MVVWSLWISIIDMVLIFIYSWLVLRYYLDSVLFKVNFVVLVGISCV